jgi:hypothetical protein
VRLGTGVGSVAGGFRSGTGSGDGAEEVVSSSIGVEPADPTLVRTDKVCFDFWGTEASFGAGSS